MNIITELNKKITIHITTLMINHINSIIWESLNEKTPYDLAELLMQPKALELLGLR